MDETPSLEEAAKDFAKSLSDLVSAFRGVPTPFKASSLGNKFSVTPQGPIPLTVGSRELLSLHVTYRCIFDHAGRYLTVDESSIKVFAGPRASGDPLFRYEYQRDMPAELPAAHVHVHAHRDGLVATMALAGAEGVARRAPGKGDKAVDRYRMAKLHFPVGGHRFRPALEDILQMVQSEFGTSTGDLWPDALQESREAYRRSQVGAVVRDCPSEAVRVLIEMGYSITDPESGPAQDRKDRLRAF